MKTPMPLEIPRPLIGDDQALVAAVVRSKPERIDVTRFYEGKPWVMALRYPAALLSIGLVKVQTPGDPAWRVGLATDTAREKFISATEAVARLNKHGAALLRHLAGDRAKRALTAAAQATAAGLMRLARIDERRRK